MDPADAVKALSGIVCTRGRLTCLNAVAEALDEVLGAFNGQNCVPDQTISTPPGGEVSSSLQAPGHEAP